MTFNTLIVGLLAVVLVGSTFTPANANESQADTENNFFEEIGDEASMNWTTKTLRVKGNGFGPERVKQLGRRKILAKRAARMDAYRNMVEAIKGVQVTSNTSVEDMMLESDTIKTKTSGMLKGARTVDVTYSNDGGCEITMEVNIDRSGRFLLNALNNDNVLVTDNYPKFDWDKIQNTLAKTKTQLSKTKTKLARSQNDLTKAKKKLLNQATATQSQRELRTQPHYAAPPADAIQIKRPAEAGQPVRQLAVPPPEEPKAYTGLLVDARKLGLKPTLAPSLLNRKKEKMYGIGVLPTELKGASTADYLPGTIKHAREYNKINDWPLVVVGIRVVNESDIMIGDDDVQKLVAIRDLLEQGKVAILL